MQSRYFNYTTYHATHGWEYRRFLQKWRQIYATDSRWPPLHYRQQALLRYSQKSRHLARLDLSFIYLEALPQRKTVGAMGGILWEEAVAAAIVAIDPRVTDGSGQLILLHCANDEESLDRLLGIALEELARRGRYRLVGPIGPSPHLHCGSLTNYFHVMPPLHTPYNPPYIPELLASSMMPWQNLGLTRVSLAPPQDGKATVDPTATFATRLRELQTNPRLAQVEFRPLTAALATSEQLLSLWQVASPVREFFPMPDRLEIEFLWQWITVWPWAGGVIFVADQPAGFVLLQPDLAIPNRVASGGKNPLWNWWLRWRVNRPVISGRLVYGGVSAQWQDYGIADLLWQWTVEYAQTQGWHSITVGPHPMTDFPFNGAALNGEMQQRYTVYSFG
ncbi:MAG TPA: hypothetical protein P5121_01775 [Caldilineaceae bacterium]|nr:hypothetical protein [Caldilineaceae bacterium]